MRLSSWQTTYKIRLPGALPFIITGLCLGVSRALLAVVAAEARRLQAVHEIAMKIC